MPAHLDGPDLRRRGLVRELAAFVMEVTLPAIVVSVIRAAATGLPASGTKVIQRDRMSFVLREQGWSPAEIAQMLGIDRNTLDARMSRARKAARARRTR